MSLLRVSDPWSPRQITVDVSKLIFSVSCANHNLFITKKKNPTLLGLHKKAKRSSGIVVLRKNAENAMSSEKEFFFNHIEVGVMGNVRQPMSLENITHKSTGCLHWSPHKRRPRACCHSGNAGKKTKHGGTESSKG